MCTPILLDIIIHLEEKSKSSLVNNDYVSILCGMQEEIDTYTIKMSRILGLPRQIVNDRQRSLLSYNM